MKYLINKNSKEGTDTQINNIRANRILNNVESTEDPVLLFQQLAAQKGAAGEEIDDAESSVGAN